MMPMSAQPFCERIFVKLSEAVKLLQEQEESMEQMKMIVIGGGPAGIAMAVEAKEAGISPVVVLEKRAHACDTIVSLYHEGKRVDPVYRKVKVAPRGHLSFDTESREEFLARMQRIIDDHGLDMRYRQEVLKIAAADDGLFHVQTGAGLQLAAPIVVIAIGVFGKPVKPSYPLPKESRGRIHFSVPKEAPSNETLLVVGGGDSAAEAACFLSQKNKVTLSYRRPEFFRINDQNLCSVNQCCQVGRIDLKMGSDIEALLPAEEKVKVVFGGGEELLFDSVYYFLGGSTPQNFLESIGVEFGDGRPKVDDHGETNIPRLFLAGDLAAEKGSIMAAFNSAVRVREGVLAKYAQAVMRNGKANIES